MALRLALDGNRYGDFVRGAPDVIEALGHAEEVCIPFIVAAELRAGFRGGSRGAENESRFTQFLQKDRVTLLLPDADTTHHYATLYVDLRRAGTPIPTNDMWIAALVLQHDLVLFSRDRHFDRVPRIPRI